MSDNELDNQNAVATNELAEEVVPSQIVFDVQEMLPSNSADGSCVEINEELLAIIEANTLLPETTSTITTLTTTTEQSAIDEITIPAAEQKGSVWPKITKITELPDNYKYADKYCTELSKVDICDKTSIEEVAEQTEAETSLIEKELKKRKSPKKSYAAELIKKQHEEAIKWLKEHNKRQEEIEGKKFDFTKEDAQNLMQIYDTIYQDDLKESFQKEEKIHVECSSQSDMYDAQEILAEEITEEASSCAGIITVESPTPDKSDKPLLLPPNHPLMKNFQQMLHEHLLRIKQNMTQTIEDLKLRNRNTEQNRFDHALKLYELQQECKTHGKLMKKLREGINKSSENRSLREQNISGIRDRHEKKALAFKEMKAKHNQLMYDLENLQKLSHNIRKWTEEAEGEIKVAKRIICKDTKLQKDLWEEQKKNDFIYNCMDMELRKVEKQVAGVRDVINDTDELIPSLELSRRKAAADIEALHKEFINLSSRWHEVIIAITHRDRLYDQLQVEINEINESMRIDQITIEALTKKEDKALFMNGKLKEFRDRLSAEWEEINREVLNDLETLAIQDKRLEELPTFIKASEKDFRRGNKELKRFETNIRRLQFKIDKHADKKFKIEEAILQCAQDQLLTDKASEYRLKLLDQAQLKRRNVELKLTTAQLNLSEQTLQMERLKGILVRYRKEEANQDEKWNNINKKLDEVNNEQAALTQQIKIKMNQIEILSRKYDYLCVSTGSSDDPLERKVMILEKKLVQTEESLKENQKFWLMLQNYFMNLTEKRNTQLNSLNVADKQYCLLKQKSMGIDVDIRELDLQTHNLQKDVSMVTLKLRKLNTRLDIQRQKYKLDEVDCEMFTGDLMETLKNRELELLQMEEDVSELIKEIETQKDLVLDMHREALTWEAKYKLVEDTMRWRKSSHDDQSDITEMKNEIHRMDIRYKQLMRAQQKLVQDLEHCVMHRERIYVNSLMTRHLENKWKFLDDHIALRQKIEETKTKIEKKKKEIVYLKKKNESVCPRLEMFVQRKKTIIDEFKVIQEDMRLIELDIVEIIICKQQYLEFTIRSQKLSEKYRKFGRFVKARGKFPKLRTEEKTDELLPKLVERMRDFSEISLKLIEELPEKRIIYCKYVHMTSD